MFTKPDKIDESVFASANPGYNTRPQDALLFERVLQKAFMRGMHEIYVHRQDGAQDIKLQSYVANGGDVTVPVEIHFIYNSEDHIMASFVNVFNGDDLIAGTNYAIRELEGTEPSEWWFKWSPSIREAFNKAVTDILVK